MALKIEEIISILQEEQLPSDKLRSIASKLETVEQEKKDEREETKEPKSKNEFVIFVRGDQNLKKVLQQGWVVQVKSGEDIQCLPLKMRDAAKDNNAKQKRKKKPLTTWASFFAACKRPFLKERGINVKTKEAVQVVVLENEEIGLN